MPVPLAPWLWAAYFVFSGDADVVRVGSCNYTIPVHVYTAGAPAAPVRVPPSTTSGLGEGTVLSVTGFGVDCEASAVVDSEGPVAWLSCNSRAVAVPFDGAGAFVDAEWHAPNSTSVCLSYARKVACFETPANPVGSLRGLATGGAALFARRSRSRWFATGVAAVDAHPAGFVRREGALWHFSADGSGRGTLYLPLVDVARRACVAPIPADWLLTTIE